MRVDAVLRNRAQAEHASGPRSALASLVVEGNGLWIDRGCARCQSLGYEAVRPLVVGKVNQSETTNLVTDRKRQSDTEHLVIFDAIQRGISKDVGLVLGTHLSAVDTTLSHIMGDQQA